LVGIQGVASCPFPTTTKTRMSVFLLLIGNERGIHFSDQKLMTNFFAITHDSITFFFSLEDLSVVFYHIAGAILHPVAKIHVFYESNLSARKVISSNCNLKLDTTLGTCYCLVCIQRFIRMTNKKTYFSETSFKTGPK
jgi:hypothetical protein